MERRREVNEWSFSEQALNDFLFLYLLNLRRMLQRQPGQLREPWREMFYLSTRWQWFLCSVASPSRSLRSPFLGAFNRRLGGLSICIICQTLSNSHERARGNRRRGRLPQLYYSYILKAVCDEGVHGRSWRRGASLVINIGNGLDRVLVGFGRQRGFGPWWWRLSLGLTFSFTLFLLYACIIWPWRASLCVEAIGQLVAVR